VNSIQATFSSAALDAHRTTTGWSFADRTVGGIIGIEDYELRIRWTDTATLPKLMAHVRKASYLGSGGEGMFGKPIYILRDQGICDLLVTISTLGLRDSEVMGYNADAEPMVRSRDGDDQHDEEPQELGSDEGTQNEFATQVRRSRPAPSCRPGSVLNKSSLGAKQRGPVSVMTATDVPAKVKERAKANILSLLLPRELGRDIPVTAGMARKVPKFLPTVSKEAPASADRKDVRSCEPATVPVTQAMDLVSPVVAAQMQARATEGANHAERRLVAGPEAANGHTGRAEAGTMSEANTSREAPADLTGEEDPGVNPWAVSSINLRFGDELLRLILSLGHDSNIAKRSSYS
jgi:hypothetical protein